MNLADYLVIAAVLISAVVGAMRGFLREAIALARGADAVVLDGLRPSPHPSHLSIDEAVAVAREIGAPQTWLTHLTHLSDHAALAAALPPGIAPAHDGLRLKL